MRRRLLGVFAVALLASGCEFKSTDPVITTSGNQPQPTNKAPITLIWAVSTGTVQGYKVEVSLDGSTFFEYGTVQPSPGSSKIAVSIPFTVGATYYFRVRAFNQGGNSPYSSVAKVAI